MDKFFVVTKEGEDDNAFDTIAEALECATEYAREEVGTQYVVQVIALIPAHD